MSEDASDAYEVDTDTYERVLDTLTTTASGLVLLVDDRNMVIHAMISCIAWLVATSIIDVLPDEEIASRLARVMVKKIGEHRARTATGGNA